MGCAYFKGIGISSPYTLEDMAADVAGLLDHLKMEKAYACGFSLGGMDRAKHGLFVSGANERHDLHGFEHG